ncbi:MAG: hypothetical protein ACRD8K_12595, partial [Nitrososphaeraceae archaeon]
MLLKSSNYKLINFLVAPLLFSIVLYNSNFNGEGHNNNRYDFISLNFLQNSYAIESDKKDIDYAKKQYVTSNIDSKEETKDDGSDNENNINKDRKSIFNIVAVGDWDCTSETEDTVDNIIKQDPEFVLALGDLSY